MHKLLLLLTVLLTIAVTPANAQCSDYIRGMSEIEREQLGLLWEYPGTGTALLACVASCSETRQSEQVGCFIAACGMACLFVGIDNCYQLGSRLFEIESRKSRLKTYGRLHQCVN